MIAKTQVEKEKLWQEKKDDEINPGIYSLSMNEYHLGEGISKSDLSWLIHNTPSHLWDRKFNPNKPERKVSPLMLLGTITHKLVLEPNEFAGEFIVLPEFEQVPAPSRKGKTKDEADALSARLIMEAEGWADKIAVFGTPMDGLPENKPLKITATLAQKSAFKTRLEERVVELKKNIIDAEQLEQATAMANTCLAHPRLKQLFSEGKAEQCLYWRDEDTGVLCKSRPDYMRRLGDPPFWCLSDLKSTGSASPSEEPGGFARVAHGLDYHVQDAMMRDGMNTISGENNAIVVFVAVERERPFAIAPYTLDEDAVQLGRELYKEALEIYKQCLAKNEWPGYSERLTTLKFPGYAYKGK